MIADFKKAWNGFVEDRAMEQAAALAFYGSLTLPPVIVVAIYLIGQFVGQPDVQSQLLEEIGRFTGPSGVKLFKSIFKQASVANQGITMTILGLLVLLFSAGGTFSQLQISLDRIFQVEQGSQPVIQAFFRNRLLGISILFFLGFFILGSMVSSWLLNLLVQQTALVLPGGSDIWQFFNWLLLPALHVVLFSLLFYQVPNTRIGFGDVLFGGFITAVLFTFCKEAFGVYLAITNPGTIYGAAGYLIMILLWLYVTALVVFFGAELTWACSKAGPHGGESP